MQEKEERGKESSSGMGPRIEYRGRGGTNLRKLERAPGPYVTDSRSLSSATNNVGPSGNLKRADRSPLGC